MLALCFCRDALASLKLFSAEWAVNDRLIVKAWALIGLHIAHGKIEHAVVFNAKEANRRLLHCVLEILAARSKIFFVITHN